MSDLLDDLGASDRKITRRERMARERDAHKKARKGGRGRRRWRSVVILALAVAFLSGTTTYFIPEFFTDSAGPSDYTGPGSGETTVEVPAGASGAAGSRSAPPSAR